MHFGYKCCLNGDAGLIMNLNFVWRPSVCLPCEWFFVITGKSYRTERKVNRVEVGGWQIWKTCKYGKHASWQWFNLSCNTFRKANNNKKVTSWASDQLFHINLTLARSCFLLLLMKRYKRNLYHHLHPSKISLEI